MEESNREDHPDTPSSEEEMDATDAPRLTAFERLMRRRGLLIGLVLGGFVLVAASAVVLWFVLGGRFGDGGRPTPGGAAPELKPPPSLEEVAEEYPQLAELLADPSLGSVYKEFIVAYEEGGVEAAKELAALRGLLNDRDEIRITLVLDNAQVAPAIAQELATAGITVEGTYRERINVGVPLALIEQLAQQQGGEALFQQLSQMEHIIRLELPLPNRSNGRIRVEGEGVAITGADKWHDAGFTGQGVRVGVLDLGFDGYRSLLGTELPASVVAQSFVYGQEPDSSGEVHGTACAEIVHEMAPDAELFLAYYDGTVVSEGQAVDWLLSQEVDIITHSAGSILGPMDGTGDDAELVDEVAATGVLWVNSAGNEGESHYRGAYTDSDGDGMHEFPNGEEYMTLWPYSSQFTIVLNWDDWQQVTQDYDLFLYDSQGELIASAEDAQSGEPGQIPAEGLIISSVEDSLYYLSIKSYNATRAATFDLYVLGMEIEFLVPEHSLNTPADARGALTVGATEYRDDSLAVYSSQGPSNDGRLKPEMTAPAGVSGATYGTDGFDGTSASTPYVAGAAALVWSAYPAFTRDEVAAFLQGRALDLGQGGPDSQYGYGRLQLQAVPDAAAIEEAPTPMPIETPLPLPTVMPLPTAVGAPSPEEPEEGFLSTGTVPPGILLGGLGVLGVCGGVIALGAAALLLVAWRRSQASAPESMPPMPPMPPMPEWAPPAPAATGPALVGTQVGTLRLKSGMNRIGRDSTSDIVLHSTLVSRHHARVECTSGGCTVYDLQSANGTFVNGERVNQAVLAPGDRLRFGDVELVYQTEGIQARAWLIVDGERRPLTAAGFTIGRSSENGISLADTAVSRRHARIEWQGSTLAIVDLDSANGTFVNGQRVTRQLLHDGDLVRIGSSRIEVHTEEA